KFLRLPLGLIGAGFLALLVTTPLVWISLVDDPLGGEPTAVVRLERSLEGVTARDIGVVEIRPSVGADDPVGDSDGDRAAARRPRAGSLKQGPSDGHFPCQSGPPPGSSSLALTGRSRSFRTAACGRSMFTLARPTVPMCRYRRSPSWSEASAFRRPVRRTPSK